MIAMISSYHYATHLNMMQRNFHTPSLRRDLSYHASASMFGVAALKLFGDLSGRISPNRTKCHGVLCGLLRFEVRVFVRFVVRHTGFADIALIIPRRRCIAKLFRPAPHPWYHRFRFLRLVANHPQPCFYIVWD